MTRHAVSIKIRAASDRFRSANLGSDCINPQVTA